MKRIDSMLYLSQSRRLAKIINNMIGKSFWTNYTAWEYGFNNIELELAYTNDHQDIPRFRFLDKYTRRTLLKTESIKEAVQFIKENQITTK